MSRRASPARAGFRALIVGGGVAGLEAMLALRAIAPHDVDVELVSSERHFYYRPLAVAEPFGLGSVRRWELGALAPQAGAVFSADVLPAVDSDSMQRSLESGAVIDYD